MYKLYQNKSSLNRRTSRILQGGKAQLSGEKIGWWERRSLAGDDINEITITLDITNAKRPDTVAYTYYGSTDLEWVILQYNNIVDINEEFIIGTKIKIPSKLYVQTKILSKPAAMVNV